MAPIVSIDYHTCRIIESDATWFGDPSAQLERYANYDVVAGQDGLLEQNNAEGGFLYLNNTPGTIHMWRKIRQLQESELFMRKPFRFVPNRKVEVHDAGNEMFLLQKLLRDVRWTVFDKRRFVSGLWYKDDMFRSETNPIVIQNNWIKGTPAKIRRARQWGHWFLLANNSCPRKLST